MTIESKNTVLVPALRGAFGDWIYYACLMSLNDVARRVNFATDIHVNKQLSDMIQRELKGKRAKQIEEYLLGEPERFFNSLVIAVYGGRPNWFQVEIKPLDAVNVRDPEELRRQIAKLTPEASEALGLLRLSGDEVMFALDGQHRLAGIKAALKNNRRLGTELASVLLVAHRTDPAGLRRTRHLFATLNKTAVAISKSETIALDENDAIAIVVRRLVEEHKWFAGQRIAFVAANNVPPTNRESLTTIGNLYDVAKVVLLRNIPPNERSRFLSWRPSDSELKSMYEEVVAFFESMAAHFPELAQYFRAQTPVVVAKKYRHKGGGSLIFRPLGLVTLTEVAIRLGRNIGLKRAIRRAAMLPRELRDKPLRDVLWDPKTGKIVASNRVLVRKIFLYMLGAHGGARKLLEKYREVTGNPKATLPRI
jgi:DNA sulfur modification protein DndB